MAKDLRVKVRLQADTKDAQRNVKSTEKGFGSLFKRLAAGGAVLVALRAGYQKLVETLEESTRAATEQEAAVTKLNSALSRGGPGAVEKYSAAMQAQAAELQKLGRAGDEAIISTQALLLEMGVAPERMGAATQATLDLSAAFGINLENAARNIGRTVGGLAGELGEIIPELKTLQTEGRLAGEGIEFLADKFAGAAAGQIDTFESALNRLNDTMGDTLEALGEGQTDAGVVGSMNKFERTIRSTGEAVRGSALSDFFGSLNEATIDSKNALLDVSVALGRATGLLRSHAETSAEAVLQTIAVKDANNANSAALADMAKREAYAKEIARERLEIIKAQIEAELQLVTVEHEFLDGIEKLGVELESGLNAKMQDNIDLLKQADEQYRLGVITRADFEAIQRAVVDRNEELNDTFREQQGEIETLGQGFRDAGHEAARFGDDVDRLRGRLDGAADAAGRLNTQTGGGTRGRLVARTPQHQHRVDAAVRKGRTPTMGGTRIRTLDGGSVLLQ